LSYKISDNQIQAGPTGPAFFLLQPLTGSLVFFCILQSYPPPLTFLQKENVVYYKKSVPEQQKNSFPDLHHLIYDAVIVLNSRKCHHNFSK
jgi:hypothetical protein